MVDHDIISVSALVVGRDGDGPRQSGPDGRAGGDCQVHAAVAFRLSCEGVLAVAELRGDDVPPVRPNRRTEAICADERHVVKSASASRASAGVAIPNQAVDAVRVGLLLGGGFCAHGRGDVPPDGFHILDGDGHGIDLLRLGGRVAALHGNHAGPLLVDGEAVHELLVDPAAWGVLPEVESIKKRLDFGAVKALLFLCFIIRRCNEAVQQLEAGAHVLNVGPVFLRRVRRKLSAIKAQLSG